MDKEHSRTLSSRTLDTGPLKTPVNSVGGLIYSVDTNRYLWLLRGGTRYPGTWGIAGGKIDFSETVVDALIRETLEEIDYDITTCKKIPLETYTSNDEYFCYHTFLVMVEQEFLPKLNYEHRGWAWTELSDVPKPLHPGLFKTIKIDEIVEKIKTVEWFRGK